jgi:hypothetical protein
MPLLGWHILPEVRLRWLADWYGWSTFVRESRIWLDEVVDVATVHCDIITRINTNL